MNFICCLYMTGVIWMVQLVHYPLLEKIPGASFVSYQQSNVQFTTWVVLPPMLLEVITQSLIVFVCLFIRPGPMWAEGHLFSSLLLAIIWSSTFFLQVPQHQKLIQGKSKAAIKKLVKTNWIRTLAWSLRSIIFISFYWRLLN